MLNYGDTCRVNGIGVTREFVGEQMLGDIMTKVMEEQVDMVVNSIYHAIQANAVTSQITTSEGEDI